jgi:hypothetical protein
MRDSFMADLPSAYPLHTLFDAAVRGYTIKLTCQACGHVRILHAHALWWHFRQRYWPERFTDLRARCVCVPCRSGRRIIVRNPKLELVHEEITGEPVPLPPISAWKRELGRRR